MLLKNVAFHARNHGRATALHRQSFATVETLVRREPHFPPYLSAKQQSSSLFHLHCEHFAVFDH
jgi:hypothetical protein